MTRYDQEKVRQQAIEMRASGCTMNDCSRLLGVSVPYLYTLLKDAKNEIQAAVANGRQRKLGRILEYYNTVPAGQVTDDHLRQISEELSMSLYDVRGLLAEGGFYVPDLFPASSTENKKEVMQRQIDQVVQLLQKGLTVGAISGRTGIPTYKIYVILRSQGIKSQSRREKHAARVQQAVALYNEGKTVQEIAKALDMEFQVTNVYPLLHEGGINVDARKRKKINSAVIEMERLWPDKPETPPMPPSIDKLFPDPPDLLLEEHENPKQSDENADSRVDS